MATTTLKLSAAQQIAVAAISVDPNQFFDFPNRRYKSGQLAITNLVITSDVLGTNQLKVTLTPAIYDERYNVREEVYKTLTNLNTGYTSSMNHYVAVNYGNLDGSAEMQNDGTFVPYLMIIEALNQDITTDANITLTYTTTFTPIDVYSAIGGSDIIMNIDGFEGDVTVATPSGDGTLTLQLQSYQSLNPNNSTGNFNISTMNDVTIDSRGISRANQSNITYHSFYSRVFAFNDGKFSADAALVRINATNTWQLAKITLEKNDEDIEVDLTYRVN